MWSEAEAGCSLMEPEEGAGGGGVGGQGADGAQVQQLELGLENKLLSR